MNLLTSYLTRQLVAAGFPEHLELKYSLGYCQGDGVAFYGRLQPCNLETLHPKMYPHDRRKQRMFKRLIRSIYEWGRDYPEIFRNGSGYHYSHYNTMELYATRAKYLEFFKSGRQDWYFPVDEKARYMALWDEFIDDLRAYIKQVSKQLEYNGYRIIEATPSCDEVAYQFETENYRIELLSKPTDFDCFDEEESKWLCKQVLEDNLRFADLSAQVKDKQTGIVLGSESYAYITYPDKDKTFAGIRFEIIREAICNTRALYGVVARQANLMQKHLARPRQN